MRKEFTIYSATEENGYEVWKEETFNTLEDAKNALAEEEDADYISEDGMEVEYYGDGMVTEYHEILRIITNEEELAEFTARCEELRDEMMSE